MGSEGAAARLAEMAREMARRAEAMLERFEAGGEGAREEGESIRERIGRIERACARAAELAARGIADVRVSPLSGRVSCPALDALLRSEDRARPDYDEGVWIRAARGIEAAGFRLRLASATKLLRLERDAGKRRLPGDPVPDGIVDWQSKEVLVLARRNLGRRLDAALHELAHLADELGLGDRAARDFWLCAFSDAEEAALKEAARLWWDRELVADLVAAAMADAAGLRLGPRMRQFLGTIYTAREELTGQMATSPFARALWRLGGGAGGVLVPIPVDPEPREPAAWAAKALDRIATRALRAAVVAETLMALGAELRRVSGLEEQIRGLCGAG